jgi:hypothetical protein
MVWVADDFAAWLVERLADAGRRRLTSLLLGDEFERALRVAATAAIDVVAAELSPGSSERAEHLARVISEVFAVSPPDPAATGETVLETVQAGVIAQIAILEDPGLTTVPGQSSASAEGIGHGVIAAMLTRHLLLEIVSRAARGGPLAGLAAQLNADLTHLQNLQTQEVLTQQHHRVTAQLVQLGDEIQAAISRAGGHRGPSCRPHSRRWWSPPEAPP